ncbi:MAG: hypothetical protein IPJ74_16620 [Saprospiraceae bacterium]|nr:hypothetical protein [Saprospiraceae bacterium]
MSDLKAESISPACHKNLFEANVEDLKEKSILGIQAGLVFELPIAEIFALSSRVLWVQKGGKSHLHFWAMKSKEA